MNSNPDVLTTGDAASLGYVSQQTIIRCFDNGSLKGYKIPGSRFRRIPLANFIQWLKDNNMPTDKVVAYLNKHQLDCREYGLGINSVVVSVEEIDLGVALVSLQELLDDNEGLVATLLSDSFSLGICLKQSPPALVVFVVETLTGQLVPRLESIIEKGMLDNSLVYCIAKNSAGEGVTQDLEKLNATVVLSDSLSAQFIYNRILTALEL